MAFVASEYGSKNAKWVGDLHEGKSTDTSQTTNIIGIIGADTVADELNNEIGRSYGERNKGKQSRDIALGILEIYHNEGLYQVEKADGKNTFNVIRKKLSDTKYDVNEIIIEKESYLALTFDIDCLTESLLAEIMKLKQEEIIKIFETDK